MTDEDVLIKHLRLRQGIVLVLLALLSISAFLIQELVIRSYASNGAVINVSGRQRMLSEQSTVLAGLLSTSRNASQRMEYRRLLEDALDQLESSHTDLLQGNPRRNLPGQPSAAVHALFYGPSDQVDQRVRDFIAQGRKVLELDARDGLRPQEASLQRMANMAAGEYIQALDRVVNQYQLESEEQVALLRLVHLTALAMILLTLLFSATGVFRPILGRLKREFAERERVAQELMEAKELADRANQAKSEFLSGMSHDLRTPMNAILGFSELLLTDSDDPLTPSQQDSVREVVKAGDYLLHLINEVLDLARIEAGRVHIDIIDLQPRDVLDECVSLAHSLADRRGIVIRDLTQDGVLPGIQADAIRFKQVLINLISNAIKYNRQHGEVTLEHQLLPDGMLRLSVSDQGEGIPEEKRADLFQPFNRMGKERSHVEGTGIGLSIAKRLMEAMAGRIGYTPIPGGGSTFWVDLPLAGSVPLADGAETSEEGGRQMLPPVAAAGTASILLLCIDDDEANLRIMTRLVERMNGVRLISATEGNEGLRLARTEQPDLIFTDLHLPGMSGFEVLRELRAEPETRSIPVVALTASVMPWDLEKGYEAGFDNYLGKPLEFTKVSQVIGKLHRHG